MFNLSQPEKMNPGLDGNDPKMNLLCLKEIRGKAEAAGGHLT